MLWAMKKTAPAARIRFTPENTAKLLSIGKRLPFNLSLPQLANYLVENFVGEIPQTLPFPTPTPKRK